MIGRMIRELIIYGAIGCASTAALAFWGVFRDPQPALYQPATVPSEWQCAMFESVASSWVISKARSGYFDASDPELVLAEQARSEWPQLVRMFTGAYSVPLVEVIEVGVGTGTIPSWSRCNDVPSIDALRDQTTLIECASGWPFRALAAYVRPAAATGELRVSHGWLINERRGSVHPWMSPIIIGYRPLWGGLLLDVTIFATVFVLATQGAGLGRKVLRRLSKRCDSCGYLLPGRRISVCSECGGRPGAALRSQAVSIVGILACFGLLSLAGVVRLAYNNSDAHAVFPRITADEAVKTALEHAQSAGYSEVVRVVEDDSGHGWLVVLDMKVGGPESRVAIIVSFKGEVLRGL